MKSIFAFLLVALFSTRLFAFEASFEPVEIDGKTTSIDATNLVKIYKDEADAFRVDDILNAKSLGLKEIKASDVGRYSTGTFWFRMDIKNISDKQKEWALFMPRATFNGAFYLVRSGGKVEVTNASELGVYMNNPMIAFSSINSPHETVSLVVKAQCGNGSFMLVQFRLMPEDEFHKYSQL